MKRLNIAANMKGINNLTKQAAARSAAIAVKALEDN